MHHQTCARLLEIFRASGEPAGTLVSRRIILRIVLLAVLALMGAYWGFSKLIGVGLEPEAAASDSPTVLVVRRYLPAFSPVKPQIISVRNVPPEFIPPGALRTLDELLDAKGRPLFLSAVPLPEGQFLTRTVLMNIQQTHGMAALLSPGKVAVAFAVDRVSGAGGWINPGDTIAVFQSSPEQARLLFPALTVLAVDKRSLSDSDNPPDSKENASLGLEPPEETRTVLTVLLDQLQAPVMIQAQAQGSFTAVLRPIGDDWLETPHGK